MTSAPVSTRDPRLDFFRGAGMFIILIAHITDNPWTLYIPARFGFSDATEMFVFCSGMASAIAFGAVFSTAGWLMGAMRIALRLWQVYWAHLGVFFTVLLSMLVLNETHWFAKDYVNLLNLTPFLNNTGPNLIGLMTLTYVPNYFDILPMYLVILAMIPVVMALGAIDTRLPVAASALLWAYAGTTGLNLPAELWFTNGSTRGWFFNPFCWQLVFFTGFFLMQGWIPVPPVNRWLIGVAIAILVISVPYAWYVSINTFESVREWRGENQSLFNKTRFGVLRYVHFLALAYLAWIAVGPRGSRLAQGYVRTRIVAIISRVGQQSLAVFMTSMATARLFGVLLDVAGRDPLTTLLVNLLGFATIICVAALVAGLKRQPWKTTARPIPAPDPAPDQLPTPAQIPAPNSAEVQP